MAEAKFKFLSKHCFKLYCRGDYQLCCVNISRYERADGGSSVSALFVKRWDWLGRKISHQRLAAALALAPDGYDAAFWANSDSKLAI